VPQGSMSSAPTNSASNMAYGISSSQQTINQTYPSPAASGNSPCDVASAPLGHLDEAISSAQSLQSTTGSGTQTLGDSPQHQSHTSTSKEKSKMLCDTDSKFFLQDEKPEHRFLMLQYKVAQCKNQAHYKSASFGNASQLGAGCQEAAGEPPSNCMLFHSPLDKRRPLFSGLTPHSASESAENSTNLDSSAALTGVNQDSSNDSDSTLQYSHKLCENQRLNSN